MPEDTVPSSSGLGHAVFIRRTGVQVPAELLWDVSSVGRAPALQAGGHRFKSDTLHETLDSSSMVERPPVKRRVVGSSPTFPAIRIGMQVAKAR